MLESTVPDLIAAMDIVALETKEQVQTMARTTTTTTAIKTRSSLTRLRRERRRRHLQQQQQNVNVVIPTEIEEFQPDGKRERERGKLLVFVVHRLLLVRMLL